MARKLVQGDKVPPLALNMVDGAAWSVPDDIPGRYLAVLFYRGN